MVLKPEDVERLQHVQKTSKLADLTRLAAETIAASDSAVPTPRAKAGDPDTSAPAPAGPVDRWGRGFDPSLHLTMISDSSKPVLKQGILQTRKGKGLADPPKSSGAPARGSDFLDLEAGGDAQPGGGQVEKPAATGEAARPLTEQEVISEQAALAATAASDAELIADIVIAAGAWLDPEKGPGTDRPKIEARWNKALLDNGVQLPINSLGLAVWSSGRHIYERAVTETGRQKIADAINWIRGKESKQGKPRAGAGEDPPARAPRERAQGRQTTGQDQEREEQAEIEDVTEQDALKQRRFSSRGFDDQISL